MAASNNRFSWFKVSMMHPGHAKKMLSETAKLGVEIEDVFHAALPSSNPKLSLYYYTFKGKSIEDEEKLKTAVENNFVEVFNAESLLGSVDKSFFFYEIDMRSASILCTIATFLKHWKTKPLLPPLELIRSHEHFSNALNDSETYKILEKYVSRNGMKKLKAWDSDTLW